MNPYITIKKITPWILLCIGLNFLIISVIVQQFIFPDFRNIPYQNHMKVLWTLMLGYFLWTLPREIKTRLGMANTIIIFVTFTLLTLSILYPNLISWQSFSLNIVIITLTIFSVFSIFFSPLKFSLKDISPSMGRTFLAFIIGGSLLLQLFLLSTPHFHGDEYETIDTAYSFSQTGDFYKWDWLKQLPGDKTDCITTQSDCRYTRGWPYTLFVSASFSLFGVSEISARIPSIFFFLITLFFIYKITAKITRSQLIALFATFLVGYSPFFIETARFARMYTMLWAIFYASFYFLLNAIERIKEKQKIGIAYLVASIFLGILAYIIHPVVLVAYAGISTWLVFETIFTHSNKKALAIVSLVGLSIGLIGFITNYMGILNLFPKTYFSLQSDPRFEYTAYLLTPFHPLIGLIVVLGGIYFIYKKKNVNSYIPLLSIVLIGILYFIFFSNRYSHPLYIALHSISALILLSALTFQLIQKVGYGIVLLLGIILLSTFYNRFDTLYLNRRNIGDYTQAYQEIKETYQEGDVIIGQFLRTYYLQNQNLSKATIVDMKRGKQFTIENLLDALTKYKRGFVVWDTIEAHANIDPEVKNYACEHFTQLHGEKCLYKIDSTKVEVFYFEQN